MEVSVPTRHSEHMALVNFRAHWDVRGTRILRYSIEATNRRLHQHKTVSAPDVESLRIKLTALVGAWDAKIDVIDVATRLSQDKQGVEQMAMEAEEQRAAFGRILAGTLRRDDKVAWENLKSAEIYSPVPYREQAPSPLSLPNAPFEPSLEPVGFVEGLFGAKARARMRHERRMEAYRLALKDHQDRASRITALNAAALSDWEQRRSDWVAEQDSRHRESLELQQAQHRRIDFLRGAWRAGEPEAIVEHATLVLDASDYGGLLTADFELDYVGSSRTLIVNYRLPPPDAVPDLKSARLIASTGEVKITRITDRERTAIYDTACYQIALRTIHELFEADEPGHLEKIVFNGTVSYVDKATGQDTAATILSVAAPREEFLQINLVRVDPKACFKSLKDVAASSLAELAPVAPVMAMMRDDPRFVGSRPIGLAGDGGENLAAMGWVDFEHLIRQVFEQAFAERGGEVRVTQASRDGGVDAVAFDPDPIRGGKVVIQAKRYTRTVDVAAVRDLYRNGDGRGSQQGHPYHHIGLRPRCLQVRAWQAVGFA